MFEAVHWYRRVEGSNASSEEAKALLIDCAEVLGASRKVKRCCAVLCCCTALCCAVVLRCAVLLYCAVLCCCTVLCCAVALCCTVLYCVDLSFIQLVIVVVSEISH